MDPESDQEQLLAAVLAEPAADLPRLVYADYLEDRGDPASVARAQFIRLQCRWPTASPAERLQLAPEESRLREQFAPIWLAPLRARGEALQNPGTHGLFRRGFVEIVWMPAAIFAWKADRLFRKTPVTELRLTRVQPEELWDVLRHPQATRLRVLDLSDRRVGDEVIPWLIASPLWRTLEVLRLRNCGIHDAGVEQLLQAAAELGHAPQLELQHNPAHPELLARAQATRN